MITYFHFLLKLDFRNENLKVIMYQTREDYSELRHSAAIVSNNSKIQSLADLRGKKACFTQYDGLGKLLPNFRAAVAVRMNIEEHIKNTWQSN
jgi:hypothetical protein